MTSLLLYLVGGVALVLLLSAMPLTKGMMMPLMAILSYLAKAAAENAGSWLIWLIKRVYFDHVTLFSNLIYKAEDLDKSAPFRY